MSIRILIADDHRILRAGVKTLLSADPNLIVVGEATSGEEAIQAAREHKPDILLLDISMPGLGGLEVTRQVVQSLPGVRILMLTMHEDSAIVREYMRLGIAGYIIKRAAESELIDAIYAVWRGMIYIHPSLLPSLVTPAVSEKPKPPHASEPLTAREIELIRYIVRGYTNRQIANELTLSVRTVETHRSNLMDKLNLSSRLDLIRYAVDNKLVTLEDAEG